MNFTSGDGIVSPQVKEEEVKGSNEISIFKDQGQVEDTLSPKELEMLTMSAKEGHLIFPHSNRSDERRLTV